MTDAKAVLAEGKIEARMYKAQGNWSEEMPEKDYFRLKIWEGIDCT